MKRFLFAALFLQTAVALGCPSEKERPRLESAMALVPDVETSTVPVDYVAYVAPPDQPNTCFAVVSLSDRGDCHACGATIGVYELEFFKGHWIKTLDQPALLSMGSFGKAPQPEVIDLNGPALRFDLQGMHFGYVGETYVYVAKVDKLFAEVLDLPVHGDNSGSGEEESFSWTATPKFVPLPGGYPDIEVVTAGTDKPADKIVPVDGKKLYRYYQGKYVLDHPTEP